MPTSPVSPLLTSQERKRYYALKKKGVDGRTSTESAEYKKLKALRMKEKAADTAAQQQTLTQQRAVLAQQQALLDEARAARTRTTPKGGLLDDLVDVEAMASKILASGLDVDLFEEDLGDIPKASNVLEFLTSPTFMDYSLLAWQMKVLVELFAEWCTECSDRTWFSQLGPSDDTQHLPLSATLADFRKRVQLYEFGVCPHCGGKRTDQHGHDQLPYELVACVGQRAGKSILVGLAMNYILHRYLCMKNPTRAYGVAPGQPVYITFAAKTITQAMETLWDAFNSAYRRSPWFREYHAMLKRRAVEQGIDPELLYKSMSTFVWYGTKMITVKCEAADAGTLRGRTRLAAAIDELSWLALDGKKANGPETHEALKNSLWTIRRGADTRVSKTDPNVLQGLMLNVSSPRSQFDPLMTLLKNAPKDKRVVTFHAATWEVNPAYSREALKGEEAKGYSKFMRDFGAMPPLSDSPFLENGALVDRCVMDGTNKKPLLRPHWKTETRFLTDALGIEYVGVKLLDFKPGPYPYIITCDAGESNNHFGIGLYHLEPGDDVNADYVRCAGLVDLAPEKDANGDIKRIHFPSVIDLIIDVCARAHVIEVVWDQWQSTTAIQSLGEKKIAARKVSVKEPDFNAVRNRVHTGSLRLLAPEPGVGDPSTLDPFDGHSLREAPAAHMALQLKTVRELGRKVCKPEKGEDDLFRTLVLAVSCMQEKRDLYLRAAALGAKRFSQGVHARVYHQNRGGYGGLSSTASRTGVLKLRGH